MNEISGAIISITLGDGSGIRAGRIYARSGGGILPAVRIHACHRDFDFGIERFDAQSCIVCIVP
jgi:hypothetical protein